MGERNGCDAQCTIFYFLFFIIIIIYGIYYWCVDNTRFDRINEYNYRAKEWVDHGIQSFDNVTFRLNKETVLSKSTERSGTFYPVRDKCTKEGDPSDHCVLTDALFYHTNISPSGDYVNVTITNNNSVIIDVQYPRVTKKVFTYDDLNCEDSMDCNRKCGRLKGEWKNYKCTVSTYLNNLCFRVKDVNGTWQLDRPPTWSLSKSDVGCYYKSEYNSTIYSYDAAEKIPVVVRYYKDSFISAEEMTWGCSSSDITSSSCFGKSKKEQHRLAFAIVLMSVFLLVLPFVNVLYARFCLCSSEF